jgi:hypothetical protein
LIWKCIKGKNLVPTFNRGELLAKENTKQTKNDETNE